MRSPRNALWALPVLLTAVAVVLIAWWSRDAGEPSREGRPPPRIVSETPEERDSAEVPRSSARRTTASAAAVPLEVPVHVVDREGQPVPGARVEVRADPADYEHASRGDRTVRGDDWSDDDDDGGGGDGDWDDGAAADDEQKEEDDGDEDDTVVMRVRQTVAQATTGADGVARLPVYADVAIVFFASDDEGRRGTSVEHYFGRKRAPGAIRIEIDALAILRGRVTDAAGEPVRGARVEVWALSEVELDDDTEDEAAVSRTGDDGRYRFELPASGAFDVDVAAEGFQDASASAVQALAGSESIRDFTLLPAEVIAGTVLDPHGDPAPDTQVFASRSGQRFSGNDEWSDRGEKSAWTDDDGRFRFPDLAPGTYVIGAEPDDGRPAEVFDVRTGTTDLVVRLVAGGRIRGTVSVRDPAAHGAKPARRDDGDDDDDDENGDEEDDERASLSAVWAGWASLTPAGASQPIASGVPRGRESESPSGVLEVRSNRITPFWLDASGNGTFTTKPIAAGTYELLVHVGQATGQRRVTVTEGGMAQVSFALPETTASGLEGTVRSANGKPFLQCVVTADNGEFGRMVRAGDDGRYLFPWLQSGSYLVSAQGPLEGGGWGSIEAQPVTVPSSGRARLDLVLPTISTEEREKRRAIVRATPVPAPSAREEPGEWKPDVRIREADDADPAAGWVVVSAPAGTPRLLGGDRLIEIDGVTLTGDDSDDAYDRLYGEKDTLCRIRARRPTTGETVDVALPRTVNREDDPDDGW